MSMLLDGLLRWIAGVLDRNLLTVPELDDDWPFRNELTCPTSTTSSPVHSYSKDGQMRNHSVSDPVYSPNSKGGPRADTQRYGEPMGWHTDGEMVRTAYN